MEDVDHLLCGVLGWFYKLTWCLLRKGGGNC